MPSSHPVSAKIKHIFVLMLENRSFDHMFGKSGIDGIEVAQSSHENDHLGTAIPFGGGAPEQMAADPAHEFESVVEQLGGPGAIFPSGGPYPAIKNTGFAANFHKVFKTPPAPGAKSVAAVMQAINPAVQTPALLKLAKEFAICDRWHASMPGATWPNRFFVHGASSAGLDHSPNALDIAIWEAQLGNFKFSNGSIYDRLGKSKCRLYQDKSGPLSGKIPQVAAIKNVNLSDVRPLARFEADLAKPYPYAYTFIEPAYGNILNNSYRGGSSQHPLDGLANGDRLVAKVYNAIRNSSLWDQSLLVITFDEHGGFYDHVPPPAAIPPGDAFNPKHNKHGFNFSTYGVRVPAVVVSPWIAAGTVDHTLYDHSSVPASLTRLFGKDPLTERDKHANDFLALVTGPLRSDCPQSVSGPPVPPGGTALTQVGVAEPPVPEGKPIEEGSQLPGFIFVARKAQMRQQNKVKGIAPTQLKPPPKTTADAQRYLESILPTLLPKN
jgi:phospholipase C